MGSAKRKRITNQKKGQSNSEGVKKVEEIDLSNYDSRINEKSSWAMEKIMEDKGFDTFEDADEFIKGAVGSGEMDKYEPKSPEDKAQMLAYDAISKKGEERRKMALEALEINSNCADAYVILAELEKNKQKKMELYQKGVDAGRKTLGDAIFAKEKGNFWYIVSTRPFMRAMEGLAFLKWGLGNLDEVEKILEEILELNPDDNQGMRYFLFILYMQKNKIDDAEKLINAYADEESATWEYNKALLLYTRSGITMQSKRAIRSAFDSNKYVPAMMITGKALPRDRGFISPGQPDEAASYIKECGPLWVRDKGALKWLVEEYLEYHDRGKI